MVGGLEGVEEEEEEDFEELEPMYATLEPREHATRLKKKRLQERRLRD